VSIETVQVKKPKMKMFMRSIGAFVAVLAAHAATNIGGGSRTSRLGRWRPDRDKSRRALAALDDGQLCNLSDIGRQIRREARRAKYRR
jgi:uncharacterized protein YjiS (DUF1127 family)